MTNYATEITYTSADDSPVDAGAPCASNLESTESDGYMCSINEAKKKKIYHMLIMCF